jgi:hypothetical protein
MPAMRRLFAHLVLALFTLRALVPAGYMPDLGALGGGTFEIVLCTAHGGDAPAVPQKPPRDDCPFGMALAKNFVAPSAPALPARIESADAVAAAPALAELLPPPVGPPLGSRAPPVLPV